MTKTWSLIFANQNYRHSNVANFPVVSVGPVILKKLPNTQEYMDMFISLPVMQEKKTWHFMILCRWLTFELITVSKSSIQNGASDAFSNIAPIIQILGANRAKISFIRGMPSFELRNCNILPPLVSFLPLNASLALADTRDTI
jgi:hypothetical protein